MSWFKKPLDAYAESKANEALSKAAGATIVSAHGTAVGRLSGAERSAALEQAMVDAVLKATAEGITDPEEVKALKLKAMEAKASELDGEVK